MTKTAIVGLGMTPVGEHWGAGLRELAAEAGYAALEDAGLRDVDALFIGNAYGSTFSQQSQLGALIADFMGLAGVEAYSIEAGDASGGVALRAAHLAVLSGEVETALVIGVEKTTDIVAAERVAARNVSLDAEFESRHGATLPSMAALLMRRYMHEYGVDLSQFEGFSINAHANGQRNTFAMFRNAIRAGAFANAPMVAEPVSLFDGAPDADGAAAVVITRSDGAAMFSSQPIWITGSAVATDALMLQDREHALQLSAITRSFAQALRRAGVTYDGVNLFEMHDAYTILTAMAFEACGMSELGTGWQWAQDYERRIGLAGEMPISTFGGLKSRGNPAGATGVYQAVEAALQLRGHAGDNQVVGAQTAVIQSVGGLASTVVTHVLQADA